MPAAAKVDRPVQLTTRLPESVMTPLVLHLWSTLENRVPKGAYQEFFTERIREFFSWRRTSLEMYGFPQGYFVAGPREMIDALERRLKDHV